MILCLVFVYLLDDELAMCKNQKLMHLQLQHLPTKRIRNLSIKNRSILTAGEAYDQ